MATFRGFVGGKVPIVLLPEQFFREVLPAIDDLAELKVTLFAFWALNRKRGEPRFFTQAELEENPVVLQALESEAETGKAALWAGLERAVARGTLLRLVGRAGDQEVECYVLNSEKGRQWVRDLQTGRLRLEVPTLPAVSWASEPGRIFALYEQNIGLVPPLLVDELQEAEETYPWAWIEEAFLLAVRRNVRRWSYVRAILERWAREGKDEGEKGGG